MQTRPVLYRAVTIAAVGLFVACGDAPSPAKPSPLTASPFPELQVVGPDSIEPGQSVQFVAHIREADGTTTSATSMPNLRWASSNTPVISVSSSGLVTASDSAYGEAVITAEVTNHTSLRGTRAVASQPEFGLNGPYTISVDTVSPCSLNSTLQHRTYDAEITTTGTVIDVLLTEPRFRIDPAGRGNRLTGSVVPGGATFSLGWYAPVWDFYANLVEHLGDNYLVVDGNATTTGNASGLTGTLDGSIMYFDSRFTSGWRNDGHLGGCSATNIQFRVTPR